MPQQPRFIPATDFQGCDEVAKWQYVPLEGLYPNRPHVSLTLLGGKGLWVLPAKPGIVDLLEISQDPERREFLLLGRNEGITALRAIDSNQNVLLEWTVEVTFQLEFRVECLLDTDVSMPTRQTAASIALVFNEVNAILEPQANVRLVPERFRQFRFGMPFVSPGKGASQSTREWHRWQAYFLAQSVRNSTNRLNVFFVARVDGRPASNDSNITGTYLMAKDFWKRKLIVVEDEDTSYQMGRTLAHEFAHHRGVPHNHSAMLNRSDLLMWGDKSVFFASHGLYLYQSEIAMLRKGGTLP